MTDAEPGGERTARRSPRRSPIRGGGATASYSRCRMMLHFDHIRPPHLAPEAVQIDARRAASLLRGHIE